MKKKKNLDSKSKAFADEKIKVAQKLKSASGRIEKIVGKGENAGYQHFLLFPLFLKVLLFRSHLKSGLCKKGLSVCRQQII